MNRGRTRRIDFNVDVVREHQSIGESNPTIPGARTFAPVSVEPIEEGDFCGRQIFKAPAHATSLTDQTTPNLRNALGTASSRMLPSVIGGPGSSSPASLTLFWAVVKAGGALAGK